MIDGSDEGQLIVLARFVISANVPSDCYERIGAHVHGDDVGFSVGVAVEGAKKASPCTGTYAGGAVKVVNPASDWFLVGGDD